MEIERGEDPGIVSVKGYPSVLLEVKEFIPTLEQLYEQEDDLRYSWGRPVKLETLSATCKVVSGDPPNHWETCTPYGHYRVAIKDLRRVTPLELLAVC